MGWEIFAKEVLKIITVCCYYTVCNTEVNHFMYPDMSTLLNVGLPIYRV